MSFMNIDLRNLRHITVLSRQLSYTKAAQELCITQSALSRSIQAVEEQANVRLFDRDRSGVHLTTVGREVVRKATQLLRDAEDLERTLQLSAGADVGEVSFGIGPLAAQALLPNLLPELFMEKPALRTRVMVRDMDSLLPALVKQDIELAVTAETDTMNAAPLKGEFLGWFPISLIVRTGHPLFAGVPTQKAAYPLLSPGQFSISDKWPPHFRRYLTGPLHIIENYEVASSIAQRSDAIWLSSTLAAIHEINAGRLQEIEPPKKGKTFRVKMMIYSSNKRSLSPGAVTLKDMFQRTLRTLEKN